MNATFNLKRFLLLEQYKRNETGRHLLWSAAVVSFICILCILYDINRGGSYYGKHTSATEFLPLRTMFYPHGPLPAGNKIQQTQLHSRYTAAGIGIREVPAYLDKIPAAASPILRSTDSLPQRSAVLKRQRVPAVFRNAHHDVPDTQHPDTDQCNPACFRLHRLLRLQSASPAEKFHHLCRLHCRLHRNCNFVASLMPEARADGYWMDNIATWPHTNYPLSAGAQASS